MKILVLGDFHGKFPSKIRKIVKNKGIDIVVSNGDYFPFLMRKLFFKYIFGGTVNEGLWSFIGRKKYKDNMLKELKGGEYAIKNLNNLPVPVLTVVGNLDYENKSDVFDINSKDYKIKDGWKWAEQDFFSKIIKKYKNINRIDYNAFKFGDLIFIGMNGHSFPGRVKSRAFRRNKLKLIKLFKRYKKEKIVFVSHNIAYNTKLDLIKSKKAHKIVKGKHYGSKLARLIIDKFRPTLHFGGHIHEGRGIQKLGKTLCINPGSVHEGQMAIVEINDNKIKTKFIK